MSDKELVACRLSYEEVSGRKNWKVECQAIPWDAAGPGVLTVNLALWWLSMMGISERYRAIKPREQMIPINLWWEDQSEGRTVGFTVR